MSDRSREALNKANVGRVFTQEALEKIRAAIKARWNDPDSRKKMISAMWTEEKRERLAQTNRDRGQSEESRAKISAAKTGHRLSPEHRAKIGIASRAAWAARKK